MGTTTLSQLAKRKVVRISLRCSEWRKLGGVNVDMEIVRGGDDVPFTCTLKLR